MARARPLSTEQRIALALGSPDEWRSLGRTGSLLVTIRSLERRGLVDYDAGDPWAGRPRSYRLTGLGRVEQALLPDHYHREAREWWQRAPHRRSTLGVWDAG